jgi:transposase
VDSGVTLTRNADGRWLPLTYAEEVPLQTLPDAPVVGVDIGIAHFLTTSTGKHYGSFQGKLAQRHQRDCEKRRRKAKLRACLKKKGVERPPSMRNFKLARAVRQEINRPVNELYRDHAGSQIAFERLNVATMRFKARRMNAYLYASNLAHIPKYVAWGGLKRGVQATAIKSAYSSQECPAASLSTGAIAQRSKRFAVESMTGGCAPTTTGRSTSPHGAAIARSRLPKPGRSPTRSWMRAISGGGTKPVGRSPTAQLLVPRA